jgi:hypothetical protein
MTQATTLNILKYVGAAALAMLVGMLPVLIGQLNGDDPINWRPIMASGLSALLSAITATGIATQFGRLGSENITSQVNDLRAAGVHRADMTVVEKAPGDPEL